MSDLDETRRRARAHQSGTALRPSPASCADCHCSWALPRELRCEPLPSSRSTPCMWSARRSHCRGRGSANWRCCWIFRPAQTRRGTTRICARPGTRRSGERLVQAGRGTCIEAYLSRLQELESRRPAIGGDHRRFDEVRSYREDVARLSLATMPRSRWTPSGLEATDPCHACRQRRGRALPARDAVPDHRRRRGLRGGSGRGVAKFPDRVCVPAAGPGIGGRGLPALRQRPRAFIGPRTISAAHGTPRLHGTDQARARHGPSATSA